MNDSQSSITMMDLPMKQKRIIFSLFVGYLANIDCLCLVSGKDRKHRIMEFSEKLNNHMRTVTNEDVNEAIKLLIKTN